MIIWEQSWIRPWHIKMLGQDIQADVRLTAPLQQCSEDKNLVLLLFLSGWVEQIASNIIIRNVLVLVYSSADSGMLSHGKL